VAGVEKGTLAEAIAREDEDACFAIVERESETAVEAGKATLAPEGPRLEQDLGVGARSEHAPPCLELCPQLQVVVDLAVVAEPVALALVAHRLGAESRVDHAQPRRADGAAVVYEAAGGVRTAMGDGSQHAGQNAVEGAAFRLRGNEADDAAHGGETLVIDPG